MRLLATLITISSALACTAIIANDQVVLPEIATIGKSGYVSGTLIYPLEGRQTPECHASTIVETPDGLVAAWFGGKHERNTDVGIWVSLYRDNHWSKPFEVFNGSVVDYKNSLYLFIIKANV